MCLLLIYFYCYYHCCYLWIHLFFFVLPLRCFIKYILYTFLFYLLSIRFNNTTILCGRLFASTYQPCLWPTFHSDGLYPLTTPYRLPSETGQKFTYELIVVISHFVWHFYSASHIYSIILLLSVLGSESHFIIIE